MFAIICFVGLFQTWQKKNWINDIRSEYEDELDEGEPKNEGKKETKYSFFSLSLACLFVCVQEREMTGVKKESIMKKCFHYLTQNKCNSKPVVSFV